MILVLALAAIIWGVGHLLKAPTAVRVLMLALLYLAVLAAQLLFPDGHSIRVATGGSPGEWLIVGVLALLVWGYVRGLRYLKTQVRPENLEGNSMQSNASTSELERNARHIVLREIGGPGQQKLKKARVLVVGAGGLGAPALQYLAAAGVGTIGVIDDDKVENSNLQRQVIHNDDRIGMPKVFSAEIAMRAQNPFIEVRPFNRRINSDVADQIIGDFDLVLDGTDDADTRYLVNDVCTRLKIPLISAAISQWEGQISVFDPSRRAPCYRCVFPEQPAQGLAPSCAEGGVLGPLPGVVGSMMAVEAIKFLAGAGETLLGRLMIYDALYADVRTIRISPRQDCATCGSDAVATGSG
ncbi:MAG: molybdopterin-synthase adenylyltransferase MoeB [Boseongicola sp.]|nr:MAG: molybdopterin-synthase adenylyltransferase MoeB [Boseongicola sp.]